MDVAIKSKQVIIGSICVLLSHLFFQTNNAIVKYCGVQETQILFGRFLIQIICGSIWWIILKYRNKELQNRYWYGNKPYVVNIWLRGIAYFIEVSSYYYALKSIPVGDAECIFQIAPLLTILIAAVALKEELPKLFIFIPTLILSTVGLIILSQPTFLLNIINTDNMEPLSISGVTSIVISSIAYAIFTIMVRIAKSAHFLQLDLVSSFQSLFILIPLLILINQIGNDDYIGSSFYDWTIDAMSIFWMLIVGVIGFGSMIFVIIGYQYGDATKVSWLEYMSIVYAFIYQTYWFHQRPNLYEIIGVVMVTFSCLLPFSYELYIYITTKATYQQIYFDMKYNENVIMRT